MGGDDRPVRALPKRVGGHGGEAERRAKEIETMGAGELERLIRTLEEEMHDAAADLKFEYAARLRDEVNDLKRELRQLV